MITVTLSDDIERIVREALERGGFESPEAVIEAAVANMFDPGEDEDVEELRAKLREAEEDIERGDVIEVETEEELAAFFEQIHNEGLRHLAQSRKTGTEDEALQLHPSRESRSQRDLDLHRERGERGRRISGPQRNQKYLP